MTPKEINAAITSCKDRIKDLQNKPKFYMGKGQRERAIELENIKIEALEKQVPKKPGKEGNYLIICPECGSFLGHAIDCEDEAYQSSHCEGCGQAIDWSEGE